MRLSKVCWSCVTWDFEACCTQLTTLSNTLVNTFVFSKQQTDNFIANVPDPDKEHVASGGTQHNGFTVYSHCSRALGSVVEYMCRLGWSLAHSSPLIHFACAASPQKRRLVLSVRETSSNFDLENSENKDSCMTVACTSTVNIQTMPCVISKR